MITVSVGDKFVEGVGETMRETVLDLVLKSSKELTPDNNLESMLDTFSALLSDLKADLENVQRNAENSDKEVFDTLLNMEIMVLEQMFILGIQGLESQADLVFTDDEQALGFLESYVKSIGGVITIM